MTERLLIAAILLSACGSPTHPPVPPRDVTVTPEPPSKTGEKPQLRDFDVDELLDIDQPRERKPGGAWTDQIYVGPKQYGKLFVELTHLAPMSMEDPPVGPLAAVDRIELLIGTSTTPIATIAKGAFTYHAETEHGFEHDGRGPTMDTKEKLEVFLGAAVGAHVKDAHPFAVTLRARAKTGALIYEHVFDGDEGSEYPTIVPPRPY